MMKRNFILTFFIIFAYSNNIFANDITSEINKAKQLIKENNYKAAMEILSSKIVTGSEHIEEVLQLISIIEKKKLNLIETSNKVMNLFSKNEFEEANKLSKTLDLSGIYDEKTNFIIERSKTLQNTISKRVGFINFVLAIENAIIQYRFKDGLNSIMEAVTIYDSVVDTTMKSDFNTLYNEIYTSTIFDYPESSIKNIENFEIKLKSLNEMYSKLLVHENKVRSLSLQFNSAIEKESNPTVRLGLSAYKAGADRTIDIIIRTVQRNYRKFLDEIFSYSENVVNTNDQNIISKLLYLNNFLKNNNFDQLAFYKNKIDFNDSRYFERSKLNIYDYLTFISKKDRLYYKYNEQILISKAQTLENILIDHKKNINDGELILAGETLKRLINNNTEIRNLRTVFESSISGAFFETPLNKIDKPVYASLTKRIEEINNRIYDETAQLENTRITISNLLVSADKQFKNGEISQKNNAFDDATQLYEAAKNDYIQIISLTKSNEINDKIGLINQRLKDIESELFRRDIELAENFVLSARKFLYNDDYINANSEIKKAQEFYLKHNQKSEFADNLQQRVETAIKLRREVVLNYDDAAYKNIIEWYENALQSLEKKDFTKAEQFKDKILSEKPFYEKARQLEIKILLARGDTEFFKTKYNGYLTEAMNYYNEGNFARALNGFTQLLEYNYDTKRLNDLIYNCNLRLGFIAKPVETIDKGKAIALIDRAKKLYESGNFDNALTLVNQALTIWEEVPGASAIRIGSLRRLHKPLPSMSVDNERKYAQATRAYSEEDFKRVIELTDQILATEKSEKAIQLNSNAKKLLLIRERGL